MNFGDVGVHPSSSFVGFWKRHDTADRQGQRALLRELFLEKLPLGDIPGLRTSTRDVLKCVYMMGLSLYKTADVVGLDSDASTINKIRKRGIKYVRSFTELLDAITIHDADGNLDIDIGVAWRYYDETDDHLIRRMIIGLMFKRVHRKLKESISSDFFLPLERFVAGESEGAIGRDMHLHRNTVKYRIAKAVEKLDELTIDGYVDDPVVPSAFEEFWRLYTSYGSPKKQAKLISLLLAQARNVQILEEDSGQSKVLQIDHGTGTYTIAIQGVYSGA